MERQLGNNVASKVYLEVEVANGTKYTIIPDYLEKSGNSFVMHEAKFSTVRNLLGIGDDAFRSAFTKNQKPAFDAIANGTAKVRMLNSTGGQNLLGREFKAGQQIYVQPKINIYVNTPKNTIGYRNYTGKLE